VIAAAVLSAALLVPTGMPEEPPQINTSKNHPNQTGIKPSEYRGKKYRKHQEPYRKCVAQREGRGQYWGSGGNGFYLGTYQMSRPLVRGVTFMMAKELREVYGDEQGKRISRALRATDARRWSRFYWDMAFYTVLNWERENSGAKHWAGGRFHCSPGMASYGGAR
jgi:hypothetical protein